MDPTPQMNVWAGEFGIAYTQRNAQSVEEFEAYYRSNYGVSRAEMNERFLGGIDRGARILEVGCNVGNQLLALRRMGFQNLFGVELQRGAVITAKGQTDDIGIVQGSAFDLPFKDGFFDLVYTSGVLIHISPADRGAVMDEMYRCSRSFLWGFEYYAPVDTEISYRGHHNLLWKTDFAQSWRERFPSLELVKEERFPYLGDANVDTMYLLRRT